MLPWLLLVILLAVVLLPPATRAYLPQHARKHILRSIIGTTTSSVRRNVELMEDHLLDKTNDFRDFEHIPTWLLESLTRVGFLHPTEAQLAAIPTIFEGKDVILQAQTGSGKTLVFALPILSKIDASRNAIQAVIVVPTRELGLQVAGVFKQLATGAPHKIQIMSIMEGSNNRRQQLWASAEPPHIVVGNPRALQKLVDNGRLRLSSVNFVVIDEVDACLLRPETKKELHRLLSRHLSNSYLEAEDEEVTSSYRFKENLVFRDYTKEERVADTYRNHRQAIFCSATIPQRKHFAVSCYKNGWTEQVPELINISDLHLLPCCIEHECVPCDLDQRLKMTAFLLKQEIGKLEGEALKHFKCLIFIDNEAEAEIYQVKLNQLMKKLLSSTSNGNVVEALTSSRNIDNRREVLQSFKDGNTKVLLCSDIASRGIDIPENRLVIQMSLPQTADDYLHRAGRTGRLGRYGKVITILQEEENFALQRFSNELGITVKKRVLVSKPTTE